MLSPPTRSPLWGEIPLAPVYKFFFLLQFLWNGGWRNEHFYYTCAAFTGDFFKSLQSEDKKYKFSIQLSFTTATRSDAFVTRHYCG